jgi:hypothetical protein
MPGKKATLKVDFRAWGHPLISAVNRHKITITKDDKVRDDSVIAIRSEIAAADLPDGFREALEERKRISLTLRTAGVEERVDAFGSFKMDPTDKENIVLTKADYIDPAVIGVRSNKAAADLLRDLVALLQDDDQEIELELRVMES